MPNLTIGPPVVKCLRKHLPNVHFDCHMNVTDPINYIEQFAKIAPRNREDKPQGGIPFAMQLCEMIKKNNMEVGISLSPKTPIDEVLEGLLAANLVDKMLIMTVEPGFSGQKFMPGMMEKVSYTREKIPEVNIQVDGGIGPDNAVMVGKSGANCVVAGSSIFYASDRLKAITEIREAVKKGQEECHL